MKKGCFSISQPGDDDGDGDDDSDDGDGIGPILLVEVMVKSQQ